MFYVSYFMLFAMSNPFYTIGYGGPEYFCDREEESKYLTEALENGRNVALISPRRLGKTGFIQHVFHKLMQEDSGRRCFYVDIYSTQNQQEFVKALASEILGKMDGFSEKIMKGVASFFTSCRPVFSIDHLTGTPTISLDVQPANSSTTLKEIFEYMKSSGHECFIAIDEFQQILEYPEAGAEAQLRSLMQFAPNVHMVFSGSKQHMMSKIFSSPNRPFFLSTGRMGLKPLDEPVYYEFCSRLMKASSKELPQDIFHDVYTFAHGYTYYIQDIMNRLYVVSEDINANSLNRIYSDIKAEGEVVYKDYCDLLAKGQLNILRAIADEDIVKKPFEAEFMRRHNLKALSSVKLALNTVVKNGIVANSDEGYYIYDRYLSLWLRK